MHRLRSTALPALAFAVCAGLTIPSTPALASTAPAASRTSAVATLATPSVQLAAKPKSRVAGPKKVTVHEFEQGKVTVSWTRVRGITRYQMHAYKTDPKSKFIYPF